MRRRRPSMLSLLQAAVSPFGVIARESRTVLAQPRAFFGGLTVSAALTLGLFAAFRVDAAEAQAPETAEVDFNAGVLTPLGMVHPKEIVVISVDTQPIETPEVETPDPEVETTTPPEQVTKDPTPKPEVDPPKPKPDPESTPKPKPKPTPKPKPNVDPGPKPSTSNNPYPDPPTVERNEGDPFGDANGWGELVRDGDAWATEVMRRLNGMRVPSWAAQVPDGRYRFRLKVCSDGRIDKVFTSTSSGDERLDAVVKTEVMRTKLPPMPAHLQKQMSGRCATLKYNFVWGGGRVR